MATARRTAGALGIIAFVFVAAFGWWQNSNLNWVLSRALIAMVVFAIFGFIIGLIGAAVANDAANSELKRRRAAGEAANRGASRETASREESGEQDEQTTSD